MCYTSHLIGTTCCVTPTANFSEAGYHTQPLFILTHSATKSKHHLFAFDLYWYSKSFDFSLAKHTLYVQANSSLGRHKVHTYICVAFVAFNSDTHCCTMPTQIHESGPTHTTAYHANTEVLVYSRKPIQRVFT